MKTVFIPIFVGAVMIYVSGYERRMYIDENGVTKETSFWGQRKLQRASWDEIIEMDRSNIIEFTMNYITFDSLLTKKYTYVRYLSIPSGKRLDMPE